jgi:hypothetical protein
MTEYERFGLVFTKTRVYKFGHCIHRSFNYRVSATLDGTYTYTNTKIQFVFLFADVYLKKYFNYVLR